MPYLNLESKMMVYSDHNLENPKVRLSDIVDSFTGVPLSNFKAQDIVIDPKASVSVLNNQRTLGVGVDTAEFQIFRPISDSGIIRMEWTGVGGNPQFRTARALGVAADTEILLTRVGPRTIRLQHIAGTALVTTSVVAGDQIMFEAANDALVPPFTAANQGVSYPVQSKGANYIDFADEGHAIEEPSVLLGPDFAKVLKVFAGLSPATPRPGDTIKISGTNFSADNKGIFVISKITDSYVEMNSPYGILETKINTAGGLFIYEKLIGFVYLVASSEVTLIPDGQPSGISLIKLDQNNALFFGSLSASRLDIYNPGDYPVSLRIQHASVDGAC
jgi:hypothetical protein